MSEEQLAGMDAPQLTDPPFSPVEQTVIEYARRLTHLRPIEDDLYAELEAAFTLHQIMELCFTIGVSNIVNRFHATFHTPLDERTRAQFRDGSPLPLPDARDPGR